MAQLFERRTISFVIRLWIESAEEGGEAEWRGQVEQVANGESAYFRDPAGLLAHLAKHVPGFFSADRDETG
jgi:hypothetical protein